MFSAVAAGPAIVLPFIGSTSRWAGAGTRSGVSELFGERRDKSESRDEFSIAGGEFCRENRVGAGQIGNSFAIFGSGGG